MSADALHASGRSSFTDLFIRRPVLSTVLSLLIVLLGAQAYERLQIRQFPELTNTTITITTTYPGATAELMQGFITVPIQQAVASTEGIDYLTSSSSQSTSTITMVLKLNADGDRALTETLAKVNQVRNFLPPEANDPVVLKATGETISLMYLAFASDTMTLPQITDYLIRVVQPRLQTIDGVAEAAIFGNQNFAMRVWLNPERMAGLGVTAGDVQTALRANNFTSAPGQIKGDFVQIGINAKTSPQNAEEFARLVVAARNGALVRLGDIGEVELGPESVTSSTILNDKKAVYVGINATPTANPLSLIDAVQRSLPQLRTELPPGLEVEIAYDATIFIRASIREVVTTIGLTAAIVIVVIFLFLGNLRSTAIPVVTIPLSLIGTLFLLYALGYSINLMTLLAMVLAIGLVVDDAIVVVENIYRHMEEGLPPFRAAIEGARDIANPVIAMTLTLAAVYAPIGFTTGLTGALFREFAFALAGAVVISGFIALTLSPMMSSRLLRPPQLHGRGFEARIEQLFGVLRRGYERRLAGTIARRGWVVVFAVTILISCPLLYMGAPRELAPVEDRGVIFIAQKAPQYANLDYLETFTAEIGRTLKTFPEYQNAFQVNGYPTVTQAFGGMLLKPWQERSRAQNEILPELQAKVAAIPGIQSFAFPAAPLPGSLGGPPVKFVITTLADYQTLHDVLDRLQTDAMNSGMFIFVDSDLRFDNPQIEVHIDRGKANELGITMQDIGASLATMFGGNFTNRFTLFGRSYQVIPQVPRVFRLTQKHIEDVHVRTASGRLVPLSTIVAIRESAQPNALTQFQQLNSATITGAPFPGRTLGEALEWLQGHAAEIFPEGFSYDFQDESRQYVQEGATLAIAFGFAVIVIFLVLAAQFESFRDPLIILISVPMSVCGALFLMGIPKPPPPLASINIYTQVGLVTLIGLISKHGILMVEFANRLQEREGLDRRTAIQKAAGIRLRPILMTTAAMVVGVVPLLFATGAGAKSRFDIGLVIAAGMSIGTLFTLFVVPTFYTFLAKDRRSRGAREAI